MITPSDTPSAPSEYAGVAVSGFDIQAPQDEAAITAACDAAGAVAGAGVVYPAGPRQRQTEVLLSSPQGFGTAGYDIDAGSSGGGGEDWPNNIEPAGM
jgi:hypothetical protein